MYEPDTDSNSFQDSATVPAIGVFLTMALVWLVFSWPPPHEGVDARPSNPAICWSPTITVYVDVFADEGFAVNGQFVTADKFMQALNSARLQNFHRSAGVVLDVERNAAAGKFVRAVDVSRQLGLHVMVAARDPKAEQNLRAERTQGVGPSML